MTGLELKALRELAGLSQKELGLRIGATPVSAKTRISGYETGVRSITPAMEILFNQLLKN